MNSSELSGFYKLTPEERLRRVKDFAGLTDDEAGLLVRAGALSLEQADRMVENVVGVTGLPLGVATNFMINGKDYLVPMVTEEPSVIAAASNAAKMSRPKGGFHTESTLPVMIGQIQLMEVPDPLAAKEKIIAAMSRILKRANEQDPILTRLGGGAVGLDVREIDSAAGRMVIVHLLVDVRDAMGANVVNTMCEAVAPMIEELTGGKALLRIVSNLSVHRLARARAVFPKESLGGEDVVDGVLKAHAFAAADPFRAVTHNKGIMNGVIAVALATVNDTRAIEAGAHGFAAIDGAYRPLSQWAKTDGGDLVGSVELPVAVGVIGGATAVHPVAKVCRKILGNPSARELGEIMAAVGLANNLAAMRALATEGIQAGHLKLHAKNVAATAGAQVDQVESIAAQMVAEGRVSFDRAKEILEELENQARG